MAITFTTNFVQTLNGASASITSGALSCAVNDQIAVIVAADSDTAATVFSITNNNTAIAWTQRRLINAASACAMSLWTGVVTGTPPTTITVTQTAGPAINCNKVLFTAVHTGANAATPFPAANILSAQGAGNVSQSITPTATGSCLWMVSADFLATNSFAAIANCTNSATFHETGQQSAIFTGPSTQPRPDAAAFTIGQTNTGGSISWIALEVASDGLAAPDQPFYAYVPYWVDPFNYQAANLPGRIDTPSAVNTYLPKQDDRVEWQYLAFYASLGATEANKGWWLPEDTAATVDGIGQSGQVQQAAAVGSVATQTVNGVGQGTQDQQATAAATVTSAAVSGVAASTQGQGATATGTVSAATVAAQGQGTQAQQATAVGTVTAQTANGIGQSSQSQQASAVGTVGAVATNGVGQSTQGQGATATGTVSAAGVAAQGQASQGQSAGATGTVATAQVNGIGQSGQAQIAAAIGSVSSNTVLAQGQSAQGQLATAIATVSSVTVLGQGQASQGQQNTATGTVSTQAVSAQGQSVQGQQATGTGTVAASTVQGIGQSGQSQAAAGVGTVTAAGGTVNGTGESGQGQPAVAVATVIQVQLPPATVDQGGGGGRGGRPYVVSPDGGLEAAIERATRARRRRLQQDNDEDIMVIMAALRLYEEEF